MEEEEPTPNEITKLITTKLQCQTDHEPTSREEGKKPTKEEAPNSTTTNEYVETSRE